MATRRYVVGFLFDLDRTLVVLIRKNRPEWQKGLLNGVGGHVSPGETFDGAMVREFKEEAGLDVHGWRHFVTLVDLRPEYDYEVRFFSAFSGCAFDVRSQTDENVQLQPVTTLGTARVIQNLRWLIPLALDQDVRCPLLVENSSGQ